MCGTRNIPAVSGSPPPRRCSPINPRRSCISPSKACCRRADSAAKTAAARDSSVGAKTMAQKIYSATGRRKTSVARVNLKEGKGGLKINDRTLDEYFGRETARMVVLQPFQLTQTTGSFDVEINVN